MRKNILLLSIIPFFLISLSIASVKTAKNSKLNHYGDIVISEILSVYDGDTFRCDIPNYPPIIGHNMPIRINGIDCPEMRDSNNEVKQLAIRAKEFTKNKLNSSKVIKLKNMNRGKYFRIIADVEIDGIDLGQLLIREGLAKPYDGGKKVDLNATKVAPLRGSRKGTYVASKNSKVFHKVGCNRAEKIYDENLIRFSRREEAVGSGRRGCRVCVP